MIVHFNNIELENGLNGWHEKISCRLPSNSFFVFNSDKQTKEFRMLNHSRIWTSEIEICHPVLHIKSQKFDKKKRFAAKCCDNGFVAFKQILWKKRDNFSSFENANSFFLRLSIFSLLRLEMSNHLSTIDIQMAGQV